MSKAKRMEAKKRKIEAFLQVAKLNDEDGRKRTSLAKKPKLEEPENDEKSETDFENSPKQEKLQGESLDELRKLLRERKKKLQSIPNFNLKTKGHDASLEIPEDLRTSLLMRDLQSLLLYALMGTQAPVEPSRWCKFEQWNKLTHINCLAIEGMGIEDFSKMPSSLKSIFPFQLEFVSPFSYNSTLADDLSILPLSIGRKKQLVQKYKSLEKACKQGQAFKVFRSLFNVKTPSQKSDEKIPESSLDSAETPLKMKLMLNVTQMMEENYPLPMTGPMSKRYAKYAFSQDEYKEVDENSPLYAVDCEMCLTNIGKLELTKVCVVDSDLNEIYQSLVKPRNRIVNYLTRFSGITEAILENVETRLEDVQQALKKLLPPDAIWIGQSLNCDLNALEMMHPYVIDTSVIYNISGNPRRKTKLKILTHMFLGEIIQDKGAGGHDPKEDAIAAMKLVLLKIEKGFNFGDAIKDNVHTQDLGLVNKEKSSSTSEVISTSLFKEIQSKEKNMCVVGTQHILEGYKKYWENENESNVELIETPTDKESINKGCESAFKHHLTLCHVSAGELTEEKKVSKLKKWTKKLWDHTSTNGLFVTVWTGTPEQKAFVGIALNKAIPS